MKIALACSLLLSISLRACDAFVPLSQNGAPAMQQQMSSSTDAETSSTTDSSSTGGFVELDADYAAAYAKAEGSLTAAVPDEKNGGSSSSLYERISFCQSAIL